MTILPKNSIIYLILFTYNIFSTFNKNAVKAKDLIAYLPQFKIADNSNSYSNDTINSGMKKLIDANILSYSNETYRNNIRFINEQDFDEE